MDYGWIYVFHEGLAPRNGENGCAGFMKQSHNLYFGWCS